MKEFLGLDKAERMQNIEQASCTDLAVLVKQLGVCSNEGSTIIFERCLKILTDDSRKEYALNLLLSLLQWNGKTIEPMIVSKFPLLLRLHGDRSSRVRGLASSISQDFTNIVCPYAFELIFPAIVENFKHDDWRVKVGAFNALREISPRMSVFVSSHLPALIPLATEFIIDSKKQVSEAAFNALLVACHSISNDDIRHLVPQLVQVIATPEDAPKTLDSLLETTFVANVDSATLALIAPLLGKVLRGRVTVLKRKAARVIDIMCRLVQNPCDVEPFLPLLLPALDRCIDSIVDEDVILVAKASRETLLIAAQAKNDFNVTKFDERVEIMDEIQMNLSNCLETSIPSYMLSDRNHSMCQLINSYIIMMILQVIKCKVESTILSADDNDGNKWRSVVAAISVDDFNVCTVPYLHAYTSTELVAGISKDISGKQLSSSLSSQFRKEALRNLSGFQEEEDVEGYNLCSIDFSLAFGGKILLQGARLRLGKGRCYAVMGKNGCGKTTLLTNIGTGNIEGLPPNLKTIYVQHDDLSDDNGIPLVEEMLNSETLHNSKEISTDLIISALRELHFTDEMIFGTRSALSGGWKMKSILVRAMLAKPDVLLMDEPTNHLDTSSVEWLVDFINNKSGDKTFMIVSHDTSFLDRVITDVIHYENKQLMYYHGSLTSFVKIHPEAKHYFKLESSTLNFKFPSPDRLDGINSTSKTVLKLEGVTYTYPSASSPQLKDVSVKVCLGSRIVVCGVNGAGKSTLIKILVQEIQPDPDKGIVWKHHNLRIAYVAQHSFHHIEQHLDASPVEYIKWRFHGGVDKEDLARPGLRITEEEVKQRKDELKYGDVDKIIGRRKVGKTMEYECTFIGQTSRDENKYLSLEKLMEMGLSKLVQQCDARTAAMAAGLDLRSLTTAEIQSHLDDFNLEAEYGTHGSIRRLSGGQKVKLVLGAAMWNRPHIVVLDEPTNYLDREALGALTQAIRKFSGGAIIISHNSEFTDAICNEKWIVANGECTVEGEVGESNLKVSSGKMKKSKSAPSLAEKSSADKGGSTNKTFVNEVLLNPKTLESLSKKEARLLTRCAEVAGVSLEEYLSKINCKSPEWKWL